ncbi:MAG: hypothetical protein KDC35_06930 [Acidobacteria bacterium]|nr:hypothetical protein [Acidobacteriota bacterium]
MPLHPLWVHLPLALTLVLPFLVLAGLVRRHWIPSLSSLWFITALVLAVSATLASRLGETEAVLVKPVVTSTLLAEHESHGQRLVISAWIAVALALGTLVWKNQRDKLVWLLMTLSLILLWFGITAGHTGGRLVFEDHAVDAYLDQD